MWIIIVELKFYHLPTLPSELPHIEASAKNNYLLWMTDGSLTHAFCVKDHFAIQDHRHISDDLIRAWAALPKPIAAA